MDSNVHYDEKIPGGGITNARKTMRCRMRCVHRVRPVAPVGERGEILSQHIVDEGWFRYKHLNRVPILMRGILRWATGRRSNRVSDRNDVAGPQWHDDK